MKALTSISSVAYSKESSLIALPLKGQNFGLSKTEFDELVFSLKNGNEKLFERIFLSHFKECQNYLIKNYKAASEIAYDITMDTLIQFRKRLILDKVKYGNLRYLFTKMASQNLIKSYQKTAEFDATPFYLQEQNVPKEVVFEALNIAWEQLGEKDRALLESFYYKKVPLIELAQENGITDATMRKKKQRCMEKLRSLFMMHYNPLK